MIRQDKILEGIKALLDADSTLNGLLETQRNDSKVILGINRETIIAPWISVAVLTHNVNETKYNSFIISITIHARRESSFEHDVTTLSAIAERVNTLLDEKKMGDITVSGARVRELFITEVTPPADEEEGCFQVLRYSLNAAKTD